MYRPDGTLMPHDQCPMADVLRTGISVRDQEAQIERPDGGRGTALVNIEAVRDADGKVVGAVNCFQDISERKHAEEQLRILARELDHRSKNLLALVQATVLLTKADTADDFKAAIRGASSALECTQLACGITLGRCRPPQARRRGAFSLLLRGGVTRGCRWP